MSTIQRMWINQPSTLQPFHKLHGVKVLACKEYDNTYRAYFLSGEIVSAQMPKNVLSIGWPMECSAKSKANR